ncbi:MAG: response regulator [Amphritea sp.]
MFIAYLFLRYFRIKVIRPLEALSRSAETLSKGNYPEPLEPSDIYEVGTLIAAFNQMVTELGASQKIAKQHTEKLSIVNQKLRNALVDAEASSIAKNQFLANMSHEIRTPMNVIIGLSNLCLKTDLQPKQRDYVNKVNIAADSLLGIINDILDFSKIEAGKLELEEIEFDLQEILNKLAVMIGMNAREKDLELVIGLKPGTPHNLVGDPLRLSQILTNLANNAVKFTKDGEVGILVTLIGRSEEGIQLRFTVRDTGIGMEEAQIEKLFQSFSQGDTSTTRLYGGSGLGLTISKRLVNMMGGVITVASQPGKGSTFHIDLHFGVASSQTKQSLPSNLRGKRVLVVDDSRAWCEILTSQLQAFQLETEYLFSGEDALARLESEPPFDLILMDWKMPGIDGVEAACRIHALNHPQPPPIVIMVTAYSRAEVVTKAELAGIKCFIDKPVSPSVLHDTLMGVLGTTMPADNRIRLVTDAAEKELEGLCGRHILLVEDNVFNQQVAQELLEQNGLKVDIAENGLKAVELICQNEYAAVLMDIQMPEMDGYEATRRIRQTFGYADLPIIAMTAGVMAADYQQCKEAGMNDHIGKPINPQQLFVTLSRWIQGDERAAPGNETASGQVAARSSSNFCAEVQQRSASKQNTLFNKSPPLDLSALAKMVDPATLQQLVLTFITEAEQIVQQHHEAVKSRDFDAVSALGHKLKSSAKAVGANHLAGLCMQLEQQGKAGELDALETLLRELDVCMVEVKAYWEVYDSC